MFSTARRANNKFVGSTAALCLVLLTACTRDQLSLPVAQAAASTMQLTSESRAVVEPSPAPQELLENEPLVQKPLLELRRTTEELYKTLPSQSCYAYMLHRPRSQRAVAVQARLEQADRMSAALDSDTFNVDLVGDHANILSLEFPVVWPAMPTYSAKVSSVIVDYLSVPEIQDYLCNSGFYEVKLSARGLNDGRTHVLWTARVTSEGLVRLTADGKQERLDEGLTAP